MTLQLSTPVSAAELARYVVLVREYAQQAVFQVDWPKLEADLAGLPPPYAAPDGALLLAWDAAGDAGCVALRRLDATRAEMKRMYVRAAYRGQGLGELLGWAIVAEARSLGYSELVLDTYERTPGAIRLYQRLGFRDIPAYCHNPEPDTRFLGLTL